MLICTMLFFGILTLFRNDRSVNANSPETTLGVNSTQPVLINERFDRYPLEVRLQNPAHDAEGQILPEAWRVDYSLLIN